MVFLLYFPDKIVCNKLNNLVRELIFIYFADIFNGSNIYKNQLSTFIIYRDMIFFSVKLIVILPNISPKWDCITVIYNARKFYFIFTYTYLKVAQNVINGKSLFLFFTEITTVFCEENGNFSHFPDKIICNTLNNFVRKLIFI